MKLRVRCVESKETLRLQTSSPSTLHDLKTAIAEKISSLPQTLHLSLNRKDELLSSPRESLQSLGLTSGDLVFYTTNPNLFSAETLIPKTHQEKSSQSPESSFDSDQTLTLTLNPEIVNPMDVDTSKPSSISCFLRSVFNEESVNVFDYHTVLIVAVHAVFLEYGFVCLDSVRGGWASKATAISVRYTIPDPVNCDKNVVESVDLKFQILGNFVFVYGCLSNNGSNLYRLSLDVSRFGPSINVISAMNEIDVCSSESLVEREVYELWKIVKDKLCLPLHVDLCERNGLLPPACFVRLPQELKIRVLEFLPGSDILKIASVCLELRDLSLNDDLWNKKFAEEFGLLNERSVHECGSWKEKFKTCWLRSKKKRVFPSQTIGTYIPGWRNLAPLRRSGFPMVGGDYDRFPVIGVSVPFSIRQHFPHLQGRRNFQLH